MTWSPPPTHRPLDAILSPWGYYGVGFGLGSVTAPSSGVAASQTAIFVPITVEEPFLVAKTWWLNGSTVGTDSIDIGVYRMTDLTSGRMDLLRSTGGVLSAGTVNMVQETAAWKVARSNITSGNDSTDLATYTTASVTLKAGRLYCMGVENSHGSSASAVSAITGGPTFTSRATVQYNGTLNRVSLWTAVPAVDYTGTLSIAFGGTTQTGAVWALDEMSGVDTGTNHGIVQTATGTGSSVTPLATLAAFGSANNATYGVQGHAANTTSTPGTGFTELTDVGTATPAQAISTEWAVGNDTTVDATITSAAWGAIAAEIKADASAFVIPPQSPGQGSLYAAMVLSGSTATIFRNTTNRENERWVGMLEKTSTYPLPSNVTPVVVSTARPCYIFGFSNRTLLA